VQTFMLEVVEKGWHYKARIRGTWHRKPLKERENLKASG